MLIRGIGTMNVLTILFLIQSTNTYILATQYQSGIFEGERFSNFGNLNIIKYDKEINKKKPVISQNDKKIKKKCINKYELINKVKYLNLCLKDMVLIEGKDQFKLGPSLKNPYQGQYTTVDNFLLKKTKVSRNEYYNFIEIVADILNKKKHNKPFYVTEKKIYSKFLPKNKPVNKKNKKKSQKELEIEEQIKKFKEYIDDYLKLRKDMIDNLDENYIKFLMPRFNDYKDFPQKGNNYIDEYSASDKYSNYPITFIDYYQCVEYCKWQTFLVNEFLFENLTRKNKIMIIFYPVSYHEYLYASCCGDSKNLYSCGSFNITDENGFKFNFNNKTGNNNNVYISSVNKYGCNNFGIYDCTGNVRIWFSSNESDYIKNTNRDKINWEENSFTNLLDEGVQLKKTNPKEIQKYKLYRMTSKGDCNSRLIDIQNGKFENEHVLSTSPFLGFTVAAKILYIDYKK